MLVFDYLFQWWAHRPRKLGRPNIYDKDLFPVENAIEELYEILEIKRTVPVYVMGRLPAVFTEFEGKHIWKPFYSVIFLENTGNDMIYNLGHEMFHEYQNEQYLKHFKDMTVEEREIEADGFAVAFAEYKGLMLAEPNKSLFLPDKIDHVAFSDAVRRTTKDGMPLLVRDMADKYFKEFGFDKKIPDDRR